MGDLTGDAQAVGAVAGVAPGVDLTVELDDISKSMGHGRKRSKEKPAETFFTGLVFTGLFGALLYLHGAWFWAFPMVMMGVLPAMKGLTALLSSRRAIPGTRANGTGQPSSQAPLPSVEAERAVLLAAKEGQGRITPALVALRSSLSIQKADEILQDMTSKGFAQMRVTDDGRVEYVFPEFEPPAAADS